MKRNHVFSILTIVCVMVVIMSGCKKNEGDVVTMRGHAGQFGNGKVYMAGNLPMWTSGDTLMANDLAYSVTVNSDGIAEWRMPSAAIYKAVYPAGLVNDMSSSTVYMTIPKHQCYYEANGVQVINAPMGACSNETDLNFKNLGALLAITINNNSSQGDIVLDKVTVKSVDNAIALCGNAVVENFTSSASEYYYRITDAPSTANSSVELVKGTSNPNTFASLNLPIAAGGFKVVYVYVPAVANLVANRYEITVDAHAGSENITVTRTQPAENAYAGTLQRNDMGSVNFQMEAMTYPEGTVEGGLFSVSPTKQVFFANGNLQYYAVPAPGTWRFAINQYDIIDGANAGIIDGDNTEAGANYNGWIDLFGWATSGDQLPNDRDQSVFRPYATNYAATTSRSKNYYGYGPSAGTSYNPNLVGSSVALDWGTKVHYGNMTWRTLTQEEYSYLMNTRLADGRSSGLGHNYTFATINSVSGVLVYPDGYTQQLPNGATLSSIPAGCVFLPDAGIRIASDNGVEYEASTFAYWTASTVSNTYTDCSSLTRNSTMTAKALAKLQGRSGVIEIGYEGMDRCTGCAVRLVCDYVHD